MLCRAPGHIYRTGKDGRRRGALAVVAARDARSLRRRSSRPSRFYVLVAKLYTASTLGEGSAIPKLGPDLWVTEFAADEASARLLAHDDEEIAMCS